MDATLEATVDATPDALVDAAGEEVAPLPCNGKQVGGHCWYLGANEDQHCGLVCASHGGYHDATRTFAGSSGTNANCLAVLDALNAPGSTVSTLSASGAGVGCFVMSMADDRYRVADTPTTPEATYLLSRRACACNQ